MDSRSPNPSQSRHPIVSFPFTASYSGKTKQEKQREKQQKQSNGGGEIKESLRTMFPLLVSGLVDGWIKRSLFFKKCPREGKTELNQSSNIHINKRRTVSHEEQSNNPSRNQQQCILVIIYEEKKRKKQEHNGKLTPGKILEAPFKGFLEKRNWRIIALQFSLMWLAYIQIAWARK